MKWFDKWFAKKSKEAWENEKKMHISEPYVDSHRGPIAKNQAIGPSKFESRSMNLTVYKANGGFVIEHRMYDAHTDRNQVGLHIITDDKQLGEELGKIITYEHLRH